MPEETHKAVDALLIEARRLQGSNPGERRFEEVDLDCEHLRARLLMVAKVRTPTFSDLDRAIEGMDVELIDNLQRIEKFDQRCRERGDDIRVFYVINTAAKRLTVLARDAQCARYFARLKGHIQDDKNGQVLIMRPEAEAELRRSGKALGRALRDGHPGVVTQMGENVVMEGSQKVYTPTTIVEPGGAS